jgi:hypothetical protein
MAKQSKQSLEVQNKIAEYRLRVERKKGEWLQDNVQHEGATKKGWNESSPSTRLADIGISKDESSKSQRIAKLTEKEFEGVCREISVQRHQKDIRWMAGLVTYGTDNHFRQRLQQELLSRPIEEWTYGWDQDVLDNLSHEFRYKKLMVGEWMSFGRGRGIFLTLKGDQKTSEGYLNNYNEGLKKINE